ncbi:hypothetical protein ACROYT_G020829 [Oculina patagonica]
MDVPTLMHNLKEEVTCSVCIHLYKEPKQLPCLHIFCLECLNDLARTSTRHGKIKCPLCQIEVAVPESGTMETLPSCFYLKNMLDILAIKECNTSKVTCGNCDEKSEEASYCFHCSKFWCKVCLNGHNILKENKQHRVLALKDFQAKDFEDVLKRPAFCPKELHEKKMLKFYCKECEVPACKNCVTLEHSKHDVEHLEITARAVKDNIATKLDAAKKSCQTFSSYIRELEEQSRLTEHRSQIVKGQIQQTVKLLMLTLQQQERELITEVENQTKEAQENFTKDKAKFQDQLKKSEETISQVNRLLERSTGPELVRAKTSVNELFQEIQEPQGLPPTLERKIPNTVFLKNQEIFENLKESKVGRLDESATDANRCLVEVFQEATAGLETRFEVITLNSEGEQYYCPGDYIAVEIMMFAQGAKVAGETKIVDRNDGSYAISFIPNEAGQHSVTVQINGENIGEISPIHIQKRSYMPERFIGEESIDSKELRSPWGVAVSNSNEIFVSDRDNNRIIVLNEKGEFIRSFGQNQVNAPTGISIDNEGRTFVANRDNNKILLFNPNGEYVSTVNKSRPLNNPRGISLDSQGNIIVCDTGNKCVRFFSTEGNILKTIGVGWLHMPFDCLCHEDKIFVSDREAHVIKVYNNNGRFLYEFGKRGTGDGELNHPTGLAVDKTGHLLVCSEDNHRVQVFTLDGKFVTKFGEIGEELGQIRRPTTASILKSGRIVVCEFGNNRLQIFA